MPTGISSQKYNPEVPYNADEFRTNYEVNELGDKLTNLKQSISIAVSEMSKIHLTIVTNEVITLLIELNFPVSLQMTKYSERLEVDDNEMQSDMAEGSAGWAPEDSEDGFDASGSGKGPGEINRR